MDIKLTVGDERTPVELWGNVAEALDTAGFADAALEVDNIFSRLCKHLTSLSVVDREDLVSSCWNNEIIPLLSSLGTVSVDGSKVWLHV